MLSLTFVAAFVISFVIAFYGVQIVLRAMGWRY